MITTMMVTATRTIKSPRKKADEFLSKVAVVSRPRVQAQPIIKTVTEPTKETEPELIPPSAYWADIKARWKLVKKELKDLAKDIKKLIDFCIPYVLKAFDWTKTTFKKIKEKISS